MSRIGKLPIEVNDKVKVEITSQNEIIVRGTKESLSIKMKPNITAKLENDRIILTRSDDSKVSKSLHGLYRSLVYNAVKGLSNGFVKVLELNGVGYRASVGGGNLELTLGYSHPINVKIPEGIDIKVDKQTTINISGVNKEQVGNISALIRSFRPVEPYLGKGIKYSDEKVRRKAGKAAGK